MTPEPLSHLTFFRSFMFALAEGLLERRDLAERNR